MPDQDNNLRRTKIIATLGPATSDPNKLFDLLNTGVDLVRLNFSHGQHSVHKKNIDLVRQWSENNARHIGIIADLQGPKIRVGEIHNSSIQIEKNQTIVIDPNLAIPGNQKIIGVDYPDLALELSVGDILLLDDGLIQLQVVDIKNSQIICEANNSGELTSHKGVNKQGGGLSSSGFTDKDTHDLAFALKNEVDFIALSFVKDHHDILGVKKEIKNLNSHAFVIAKIESNEAIKNIDGIIKCSDGVMVARGDLGIEVGFDKVPFLQKLIISKARANNKAVIIATQIMESMIVNTIPTRAEVSDIANAVLDCTDAIMFTAETAVGNNPNLVIKSAHKICISSEENPITSTSHHRIECHFTRTDEAIAMAAMYIANHQDIRAIISITETGTTPLLMSRIRSNIPIYGVSPHISKVRAMNLYRNVYPIMFNYKDHPDTSVEQLVFNELLNRHLINKHELVLITYGDPEGSIDQTNTLKISSFLNDLDP